MRRQTVKYCEHFLCSLVNQIRTVKEQALKGGDSHHIEQLIYLLDALSACVGSLHERNHESLIHEVLSISIWKSCQASHKLFAYFSSSTFCPLRRQASPRVSPMFRAPSS